MQQAIQEKESSLLGEWAGSHIWPESRLGIIQHTAGSGFCEQNKLKTPRRGQTGEVMLYYKCSNEGLTWGWTVSCRRSNSGCLFFTVGVIHINIMKDKIGPLVGWGAWPECLADGAASLELSLEHIKPGCFSDSPERPPTSCEHMCLESRVGNVSLQVTGGHKNWSTEIKRVRIDRTWDTSDWGAWGDPIFGMLLSHYIPELYPLVGYRMFILCYGGGGHVGFSWVRLLTSYPTICSSVQTPVQSGHGTRVAPTVTVF